MEAPVKVKQPKIPNVKGKGKAAFKKVVTRNAKPLLFLVIVCLMVSAICYFFSVDSDSLLQYVYVQVSFMFAGVISCVFLCMLSTNFSGFASRKSVILFALSTFLASGLVLVLPKVLPQSWMPSYYLYGILMYVLPFAILVSFESYHFIPQKVYKKWFYPYGKELPVIEVIEPVSIKFYIPKQKTDTEYSEFTLNVPCGYKLSEFVHYFIHRYNYDKNPSDPIFISDDNTDQELYGWIFWTKSIFGRSKVLDPFETFENQGISKDRKIMIDRYE